MQKHVVGVFDTENEAISAIQDLQERGIPGERISVISKDKQEMENVTDETGTKAPEGVAAGAATGGVLGGVTGLLAGAGALAIPGIGPILAAGPIAATLAGAAVGAGAGGLVGGLIGLGIPEDEAKDYETHINEGRILVLVDGDEQFDDVHDVFTTHRSLNADRYSGRDTRTINGLPTNNTLL
ncbi:general stress protein [Paenibacillus lemnae]|uniref:Low temperature-induced protein n=1 Tax=Paenibacillus lemnae TaxID=1330551 RepID=A0A848M7W5_PAELE|nr:general stress protein [Paenibacillus lemnae]NMO96280.1 low temperature-induced protein [Paenibacillus lemnae]